MALMTSFTNTTLIKSILPSDLRDFKRLIRLNSIAYNSAPGKSGNKKYLCFSLPNYPKILHSAPLYYKTKTKTKKTFCDYVLVNR